MAAAVARAPHRGTARDADCTASASAWALMQRYGPGHTTTHQQELRQTTGRAKRSRRSTPQTAVSRTAPRCRAQTDAQSAVWTGLWGHKCSGSRQAVPGQRRPRCFRWYEHFPRWHLTQRSPHRTRWLRRCDVMWRRLQRRHLRARYSATSALQVPLSRRHCHRWRRRCEYRLTHHQMLACAATGLHMQTLARLEVDGPSGRL